MRFASALIGTLVFASFASAQVSLLTDNFDSYDLHSELSENGYTQSGPYSVSDDRSDSAPQAATRDFSDSGNVGTKTALKTLDYMPSSIETSIVTVTSRVYVGSGHSANTSAGVVAYSETSALIAQATIFGSGYVNLTSGAYNRTSTMVMANLDAWNDVTLHIDLYLSRPWMTINGVEPDTLNIPFNAGYDGVSQAGLLSRRGSGETVSDIYWDDLGVTHSEAVPEPATISALALGLLATLRRSRKA